MMAKLVALTTHSQKVLGSIPSMGGLGLFVFHVCLWVFFWEHWVSPAIQKYTVRLIKVKIALHVMCVSPPCNQLVAIAVCFCVPCAWI